MRLMNKRLCRCAQVSIPHELRKNRLPFGIIPALALSLHCPSESSPTFSLCVTSIFHRNYTPPPSSLILLFKAQRWNPAILSSAKAQYLPAALISRQVLVEAEYSTCSHREGAYLFHITQAEHFDSSRGQGIWLFFVTAQNSKPA